MKKILLTFFNIFLSLCLLVGCKSNNKINSENSTPSNETNDESEITLLPEMPWSDEPIELPDDEWN